MKKICFITAVPGTAYSFLRDHMAALKEEYIVFYVSNEPDEGKIAVAHDGYKCVNIQRNISLAKDFKALFQLYRFFRKEQFDVVHSVTPKAGLLTAIASFFAGVPVRIHIFTGQVWASKKGVMRRLLMLMDRILVLFGNHFLVDSEGQRQYLIKNGILTEQNSQVLGHGSICGVDLSRFSPKIETRLSVREELNLDSSTTVFVFMGRLNRDKGIYELLSAFNFLCTSKSDIFLLLLGRDEEGVESHFNEYGSLKCNENFLYYGETQEPQRMLQAGDVFVIPTYREGFGSSIIEASALGIPVICSDAYGTSDAIIDGVTGLRCRVGDVDSLILAMERMIDDKQLRKKFGMAGHERTVAFFDGKVMTQHWIDYYHSLLN